MDDGDLEKETEHVLSSCAVLPSLNGGGIKCVAESLGALPSHKSSLLSSEGDFRKYWSETVGSHTPLSTIQLRFTFLSTLISTVINCRQRSKGGQWSRWALTPFTRGPTLCAACWLLVFRTS